MTTTVPKFIKLYTIKEGGDWHKWPATKGNVFYEDKSIELNPDSTTSKTVRINSVVCHSFRCHDGSEWDCINGWR